MKTTYVKLGYQSEWSNSFVACIGYFDGVHLGHQALIKETVRLAKEQQCKSAMISFSPDPWVTIKGLSHVRHLTSMSDRKRLAAEYGIEEWIILSFDKSMASLSAEAFVQEILNKMPLKVLVCGFDFHYGAKGLGTTTTLLEDKKRLFEVSVVKEVTDQNQKISTTRITALIEEGTIQEANELLGHPYSITGFVVGGRKRGREIGYPTANIQYSTEYILPQIGVYAGKALVDGTWYLAMINVGHNPTFNQRNDISVEVNILDFNQDIYGKQVQVDFYHLLRPEIKFDSISELITQLEQDVLATREFFDKGVTK